MTRKILALAAAAALFALGLSQMVSAQHCGRDCDDCGGCKVCVPKTETKKVAKPYYDCKCKQFCLPPKCQLGGHGHGHRDCGGCGECAQCAECCKPRSKKVLIKKVKIEEECVTSCKLEDGVPCAKPCKPCRARHCDNYSCDGPVIIMEGAPIQGAEPIAPPKNMP